MFFKVSMARCSHLLKSPVFPHTSASHLRDVYKAFWRPCRKNHISSYIWHKLFIYTVKCSYFNQIIVYQSCYGVPLNYFFTSRKSSVFHQHALLKISFLFKKYSQSIKNSAKCKMLFQRSTVSQKQSPHCFHLFYSF